MHFHFTLLSDITSWLGMRWCRHLASHAKSYIVWPRFRALFRECWARLKNVHIWIINNYMQMKWGESDLKRELAVTQVPCGWEGERLCWKRESSLPDTSPEYPGQAITSQRLWAFGETLRICLLIHALIHPRLICPRMVCSCSTWLLKGCVQGKCREVQ